MITHLDHGAAEKLLQVVVTVLIEKVVHLKAVSAQRVVDGRYRRERESHQPGVLMPAGCIQSLQIPLESNLAQLRGLFQLPAEAPDQARMDKAGQVDPYRVQPGLTPINCDRLLLAVCRVPGKKVAAVGIQVTERQWEMGEDGIQDSQVIAGQLLQPGDCVRGVHPADQGVMPLLQYLLQPPHTPHNTAAQPATMQPGLVRQRPVRQIRSVELTQMPRGQTVSGKRHSSRPSTTSSCHRPTSEGEGSITLRHRGARNLPGRLSRRPA